MLLSEFGFVGIMGRFVGFMGKFVGILRGSLVFRAVRWIIEPGFLTPQQ